MHVRVVLERCLLTRPEGQKEDTVIGFEAGADDYESSSVDTAGLMAWAKALLQSMSGRA
jgi:DNA-binding response OmpR family regulator